MNDCNPIVIKIYNHPDIINLISKINPESIQQDLRQELAIAILEQPCNRIATLFLEDNLLKYAIKTCWIMATSSTSKFYYKFKKSNLKQHIEYLRAIEPLPIIDENLAIKANDILTNKANTINGDHEVRIFKKYSELKSSRAVARYYNIPVNHVCNIVSKLKSELKCTLLL